MRTEPAMNHGTRGLLVFPLGDVYFGARVEEVAGLIDAERLTRLPRQTGALAGVVAFRSGMVPALDLAAFFEAESPALRAPRYAIVLARGAERVALVVPALPRLVPARDLKEAEVSVDGSELGSLIEVAYQAGDAVVHCLHYWSIFDSVMPPAGTSRVAASREP